MLAFVFGVVLATPWGASAQSTHLAVIVGLAGEPEHGELFNKWAATLVDAATGQFGLPKPQVHYLTEKPETDAKRATGRSTREEIAKAFDSWRRRRQTTWCSSC